MKKFILILVVLVVALFATNPSIDQFYQKALRAEMNMGDEWFSKAKYALIETKYNYENYYVVGLMRNEITDEVQYIGLFNQVLKIK
ncbi:MAG: hypothetical protein JXR19_00760 [Bacteroidia bacterium]